MSWISQEAIVARIEAVRAADGFDGNTLRQPSAPLLRLPAARWCSHCGARFMPDSHAQRQCSNTCAERAASVTLVRRSVGNQLRRRPA